MFGQFWTGLLSLHVTDQISPLFCRMWVLVCCFLRRDVQRFCGLGVIRVYSQHFAQFHDSILPAAEPA
jgi:hypothetical protein